MNPAAKAEPRRAEQLEIVVVKNAELKDGNAVIQNVTC